MLSAALPDRAVGNSGSASLRLRLRHGLHANAGEIFVGLKKIVASALYDLEQIVHRGNFLELLGQEPLEEIDRDIILFLARQLHERVDLMRHLHFLIE
jgi:hypothetical protein